MNNDQIKSALLSLRRTAHDFTVILSGKSSRKVHGLYKPDSREIILHNRNFRNDTELMYTAIHEYAHHLQFTTSPTPVSVRTHTTAFYNLLHTLLFEAEAKGIYANPFDRIGEFQELTREIRRRFLEGGGTLMKEFGRLLVRAHELCETHGASYSDYLDRVLGLPRTSAAAIVKAHTLDLDPRVGFENMRSLASIRDEAARTRAQEELRAGHSPDMVKARYGPSAAPRKDARAVLEAERERLQRSIERMRKRLKEVERRLTELVAGPGDELRAGRRAGRQNPAEALRSPRSIGR
jgi:hypothetical protein